MGKNKHWVAWNDICRPKEVEGLSFRSLFDVSKALFAKLWWNFRTQKSLWTNYIWNKYCKKVRSQLAEWKGGSLTLKHMLKAKEMFDLETKWEPKCGHSRFWHDNLKQLGSL